MGKWLKNNNEILYGIISTNFHLLLLLELELGTKYQRFTIDERKCESFVTRSVEISFIQNEIEQRNTIGKF